MTTDRKITVNPAKGKDGKPLHVEDELGRKIPHRENGNVRLWNTHLQRQIKFGDLVLVIGQKQGAPKATPAEPVKSPRTPNDKKED